VVPGRVVLDQVDDTTEDLEVHVVTILRRRDNKEEDMRRFAVDRVEIDARGGTAEHDREVPRGERAPVGERHTFADGGAAEALAIEEHLEDEAAVADVAVRTDRFDHLGERITLRCRLEVENAERFPEV